MNLICRSMLFILWADQIIAQPATLVDAASKGDSASVRSLLAAGADPNQVDNSVVKGWTPLMAAAKIGSIEVTEALLNAHASINAKNEYGATALDVAVASHGVSSPVVAALSAAGGIGRKRYTATETAPTGGAAPHCAADAFRGVTLPIALRESSRPLSGHAKDYVVTRLDHCFVYSLRLLSEVGLSVDGLLTELDLPDSFQVMQGTEPLEAVMDRWKKAGVSVHVELKPSAHAEPRDYNNSFIDWRAPAGQMITSSSDVWKLPFDTYRPTVLLPLVAQGEVALRSIDTVEVLSTEDDPKVAVTLKRGRRLQPDRIAAKWLTGRQLIPSVGGYFYRPGAPLFELQTIPLSLIQKITITSPSLNR